VPGRRTVPEAKVTLDPREVPFAALEGIYDRFGARHPTSRECPLCHADLMRVAVVDLAYVFTACDCSIQPEFRHLYEQLWHLRCLRIPRRVRDSR